MTIFGDLFGHDKKAARATGAYADPSAASPAPASPPLPTPPPTFTGNLATGFSSPQDSVAPLQAPKLPAPPPKRPGAFDEEHRRQTMLALAAGFFSSSGLGEGLANAAKTIYAANEAARAEGRSQVGGPDDAFEITTDPQTGRRTYTPIQPFQDYLNHKIEAQADARQHGPTSKDHLDAIGRLALTVGHMDPKAQSQGWTNGRNLLVRMGYDGDAIPESYDPSYTGLGETVPQAAAAQARNATLQLGRDRLNVTQSQASERLSQGRQRIALAGQAGARADRTQARQDLKAGIIDGYQYRRDPVTGKLQKRMVQ